LRGSASPDYEDHRCSSERGVTGLPARKPVEVETLIATIERVDWIAHPDAAAGQCNLLRGNTLGQDRLPAGATKRLVD
jgi:hypothetical protein